MRRLALLAAALVGLVFSSACDGPRPRADLVFINGAEPETLDPALITGQPEGRVVSALFEGLLRFNSAGQAEPGVAQHWEISPDARTYTFHLRPDARWSDGQPVTAHDFVRSWQRTLTPETGSQYNYQLFYLKNAEAYATGRLDDFSQVGVRALDDHTLEVELTNPTPFFLELCAFPTLFPVRTDLIERAGDDWVKPAHIITNGAFLLDDWRINDRIQLRKNPSYWDAENVALNSVDILPISKANTAFNFYASGEADLLMDKGLAPPSLLEALMERPDFHASPFLGVYFLRFNVTLPPFDDVRVRQALALTVDNAAIVRRITRAGELPAAGFVPPGLEGYAPIEGLGYDPERARALLAEAGFPEGHGFPLSVYLYSEGELNEAIAVELQSAWRRELGINIQLARQEWKVYLNSLSSLDYGIARSSWVGDYPDPNTFLDMFITGGGNNRTGWSDPAFDGLIAQAAATTDPAARLAILRQAESLLVLEATPIRPIFYYVGIQFYDPTRLGGIQGNLLDEHPIRAIFRKAPAP
jgi:oligopeptide transport system substrate-binding protein